MKERLVLETIDTIQRKRTKAHLGGKTKRHEPSNFDPSAYIPAAAIMFVCPTAKPVVKIPRTCMMSIRRAEENDGFVSMQQQQGCVREFQ